MKLRFMYFVLHVIMFFESFVWTVMDLVRSARMRWAAKINENYREFVEQHKNQANADTQDPQG